MDFVSGAVVSGKGSSLQESFRVFETDNFHTADPDREWVTERCAVFRERVRGRDPVKVFESFKSSDHDVVVERITESELLTSVRCMVLRERVRSFDGVTVVLRSSLFVAALAVRTSADRVVERRRVRDLVCDGVADFNAFESEFVPCVR